MKRILCFVTVLAIVVILCAPALGQVDLLNGQAAETDYRFGLYSDDADNNQDWVREYDGRQFRVWGIEELNSYGYNGPMQYWLNARDLIIQDEDVNLTLGFRNLYGLKLNTSSLRHRLGSVPAINPFLNIVSDGEVIFRDNDTEASIGDNGDTFIDLSPGEDFAVDRRVNDFGLSITPGRNAGARFTANWWQEMEGGTQQLLFRARAATEGVIGNRQRGGAGIPVDRSTDEGTLGTDLPLGERSVLNYRFSNTEYTDNGTRPTTSPLADVVPLNTITRFNSDTNSNILKARSRLTDRLYFTGAHTNRSRKNLTSAIPAGYDNAGSPLGSKVKIDSTNLALTMLATDALSITGRWRKYELDNRVPPIFRIVGGEPQDTADNQALSREVESIELDGTYTGIARTYLKLGFERRDTDRRTNPIHPPHDEDGEGFEHPFTNESTESNIWRLGVRYHPSLRLSFSGNFETWDTDNPGYAGMPTDRKKLNLNATYLVRDNFAVYGDFNRWDEENNEVRVPLADIPTLTAPPDPPFSDEEKTEYQETRENAAGQGYDNEFTTTNIGAWYAVNPRLTLDAGFSKVKIDSGALWVIGVDPTIAVPARLPHLLPDFVPYRADNDQWSVGATYVLSPSWRIYGRFLNSDSEGRSLIDPDIFPGTLGPEWTPVRVNEDRWTLGFAYEISPEDRLLFDFSISDWKDEIDPDNSGRFGLWHIAWSSNY